MESRPYDFAYDPTYTTTTRRLPRQGTRARALYRMSESNPKAVSGGARHKYFKRPIVPFLHAVPPEVMLAPTASAPMQVAGNENSSGNNNPLEAPQPPRLDRKRDQGAQTMYRDSDVQTDPYTPDYIVRPGEEPEVLSLAALKAGGKGLPVSAAEVEMIERARAKRIFNKDLPPTTDEASYNLRRELMEGQEMREWKAREAEIDRIQGERLALLQQAVEEREKETEFLSEQRIEALRQRRLEEKERAVAEIQRLRIKALRKLGKKRQKAEPKVERRDIISEYHNFGSSVYAPILRDGAASFDENPAIKQFESETMEYKDLEGLDALEQSIDPSLLEANIQVPGKKKLRAVDERKEKTVLRHLENMDNIIKNGMMGKAPERERLQPSWRKKAKKAERPATPSVSKAIEGDDKWRNSLLLLQRLIRGRAVQNFMFEGKERRIALIRELRVDESDEARLANEQLAAEKAEAMMAQLKQSTQDSIQGEVISATVDYLAKELVRNREEARITDLVSNAERIRRRREAEEGGLRQAELDVRQREDKVFNDMLNLHQGTAETYVDETIDETVDKIAEEKAQLEIGIQQGVLNPTIDGLEGKESESGEVVKDLVASFLMPEVDRQAIQNQVELEERRFVNAASGAIKEMVETVEQKIGEEVSEGKDGNEGKKGEVV